MQEVIALVVPCYNEAVRLRVSEFARLANAGRNLQLLMVDDGSTDATLSRLEEMVAVNPGAVRVLRLDFNRGKAEAVRAGMLAGLENGADIVGYLDADLATPVDEVLGMMDDMARSPVDVLLASRVRLLGSSIRRRPLRHYLGRVFATAASIALGVAVYDTQCGAKLFRRGQALSLALGRPFRSRWIFDVELMGRLLDGEGGAVSVSVDSMREYPLRRWEDMTGSKLRPGAAIWAGLELLGLLVERRVRRPRH